MGRKEGPLRLAIKDFFETYVSGAFGGWVKAKFEEQTDDLLEAYETLLIQLGVWDAVPSSLKPGSPITALVAAIVGAPFIIAVIISFGMSFASALFGPILAEVTSEVRKVIKDWRPDPALLTALQHRFPEMSETWSVIWDELGIHDRYIDTVNQVLIPTVPEGDLITLWLRDELSETDLNTEFAARGWNDDRIEKLKLVRQLIPGVTDLIQMAVREAFTPETVKRFGYDQDFPEEVVAHAEAQGMAREWVERYWYAHWQIPGASAGYQMMHRLRPGTTDNPFDIDDLELMLRTADIPEFFRKRLIEISYATFTRVDVRRMYKAGVLSADQVFEAYLDIGYDKEKAQALADFAILDAGTDDRDLTRSLITQGYERGTISEGEALELLGGIGFTADRAGFIIAIENADIARRKVDDELDRVGFLYKEGEIDEPGVYVELGPLNLPAEQVANYIGKWDLQKRKSRALPSKTELEDWYKQDIITVDDLERGLENRRYQEDDIERYLVRLDQRLSEEATREAERAQKEQERIQAADLKTAYQTAKVAIDVQIADARREIADIKLVLHQVEKTVFVEGQMVKLSDLINRKTGLRLTIARIKRDVQELKYDIGLLGVDILSDEGREALDQRIIALELEELDTKAAIPLVLQDLKVQVARANELIAENETGMREVEGVILKHVEADETLVWQSRILELRSEIANWQVEKANLRMEFI